MTRIVPLLIFLIFFLKGYAEPQSIQFSDLQKLNSDTQQEVEIRGFLYETDDKQLILASLPSLKSCCIGKFRDSQIYIFGLEEEAISKSAITIRGLLSVTTTLDKDGELKKKYLLENATLTSKKNGKLFILTLTIIIALIIIRATIFLYKLFW